MSLRELNLLPESIKKRVSIYQIRKLLIHIYFFKYSEHSHRIYSSNQTAKQRLWSNDIAGNLTYFTYQPQREWPVPNAVPIISTIACNTMLPMFSKGRGGWLAVRYLGSRTIGGNKYRKDISLPFLIGICHLQCKLLLP